MRKRTRPSQVVRKERKIHKGAFLANEMKKEETNDIVQNLYDLLNEVGINKKFCKQDVTNQFNKVFIKLIFFSPIMLQS